MITLGHHGQDTLLPELSCSHIDRDYVPPEIECRPANEDEIPRTAKALLKLAAEYGWLATVTYARGTFSTGRSTPRVVDSIAVRLSRMGSARIAAVWYDNKFCFAATSRLESGNSGDVREWIKA